MEANEEGEMEEKLTPPPATDEQAFVPLQGERPLNRPFDTAPLLRALMDDDGPLGVAESLDQAYATLAEYLVSDPNTAGQHYAHVLYDLRRVRNALLQGGGWRRL